MSLQSPAWYDARDRLALGVGARGRPLTADERRARRAARVVLSYCHYRADQPVDYCYYQDTGDPAVHDAGACPHCDAARAAGVQPARGATRATRPATEVTR